MKAVLAIMTRAVLPGSVKTRLIPALGPDRAAALHEAMTRRVIDWSTRLTQRADITQALHLAGADTEISPPPFGFPGQVLCQSEGDLGRKLLSVFETHRQQGADRVIVIGTDCPALDESIILRALDALSRCDLVLGPAWDGGYYLIAARRPIPELFSSIAWSTDRVLDQTLTIADDLNLSVALLEPIGDIDEPADLLRWTMETKQPIPLIDDDLVSVIIPTLNEESALSATLDRLQTESDIEIIVVDGESTDRTEAIARERGVQFHRTLDGRAAQLNLGATRARGKHLLFLHADTRLPPGFASLIKHALANPKHSAGAFRFALDDSRFRYRVVEMGTNLRATGLQLPYGDQALFTRAEMFWKVGGFPSWPIMEDFELVRRLRREGRITILNAPALTSARRWKRLGIVRTLFLNQAIIAGFYLGITPRRLANWYRTKAKRAPASHRRPSGN